MFSTGSRRSGCGGLFSDCRRLTAARFGLPFGGAGTALVELLDASRSARRPTAIASSSPRGTNAGTRSRESDGRLGVPSEPS
jgi:hypothetical protein